VRPTLRVAFAADFHAGATTDERILADACRSLTAFAPDLLLLGGDFVSVRASYIDRLAPLLSAIHAPLGKLGVLGNHDLRADNPTVLRVLRAAGLVTAFIPPAEEMRSGAEMQKAAQVLAITAKGMAAL